MSRSPLAGWRTAARVACGAGALGSLALMLYAGRHNTHRLITALFIVWVLAPFASLALADFRSGGWPALTRRALYGVTILVALASVALYAANAVWPRKEQAAFVYVAVPPATWLASAVVLAIAAMASRASARKNGGNRVPER